MLAELNATLKTAGLDLQLQTSCVCHNNFAALADRIVVEGVPIPIAAADEGLAILGVIVPFDNTCIREIGARICKAWGVFWAMRSWLLNRHVDRSSRLRLWRLAVDSTVLWASGSWTLTAQEQRLLKTMENGMFRKIAMLPKRLDEPWHLYKQRCSRVLGEWYCAEHMYSVVEKAYARIWSWAGHVVRLPQSRLVQKLLFYKGCLWRYAAAVVDANAGQQHPGRGWHRRWERVLEAFGLLSTKQWNLLGASFVHSVV